MRNSIAFFTVLLVIWITVCSWYYVCNVRMDCKGSNSEIMQGPTLTESILPDSISANAEPELSAPPDYTLLFNSGSNNCEFSGYDKDHFTLIKQYVSKYPDCRVMITGYADRTGSESLNLKISAQRAEFIRQQLLESGVPDINVIASGKGELDPVADNNSIEGRAKNRRVLIQTNKNL